MSKNKEIVSIKWKRWLFKKELKRIGSNIEKLKETKQKILICHSGNKKTRKGYFFLKRFFSKTKNIVFFIEKNRSVSLYLSKLILKNKANTLIYIDSFVSEKKRFLKFLFFTKNNKEEISRFSKEQKIIGKGEIIELAKNLNKNFFSTEKLSVFIQGKNSFEYEIIKKLLSDNFRTFFWRGSKFFSWLFNNKKFVLLHSKKRKVDLAFTLNKAGTDFEVFSSYKNKYIKLEKRMLFALIIKYFYETKKSLYKYCAVFNPIKNPLLFNLSKKYNLSVYDSEEKCEKKILFTMHEENNYSLNLNENNKNYIINFIFLILKIFVHYRNSKKDLINIYKKIEDECGYFRITERKIISNQENTKKIFNKLRTENKIGNNKIKRVEEYKNKMAFSIIFNNEKKAFLEYSPASKQLLLYFSVKSEKGSPFLSFIEEEKSFYDHIQNLQKILEGNTFDYQSVKKQIVFLILVIGINYYLFSSFFKINNSSFGVFLKIIQLISIKDGNLIKIYFSFLLIIVFPLLNSLFNSILIKKITKIQNEIISFKHIFISVLIGMLFSNLTPLPIGGEFAIFWYLRNKGVKKSTIVISLSIGMLVWNVLVIAIFLTIIPLTIYLNTSIFLKDSLLLSYLIISFLLNLIWFFIIFVPLRFEIVQNNLIKFMNWLLEWIPLIDNKYKEYLINKIYYFVLETRQGIDIIYKKPSIFIKGLFWKFCASLLPYAALFSVIIFPKEIITSFWDIYLKTIVHRVLNTISITPGGSGISEIIFRKIMLKSFKDVDVLKTFNFITNTFFGYLIPTLVSMIIFLFALIKEKIKPKRNY